MTPSSSTDYTSIAYQTYRIMSSAMTSATIACANTEYWTTDDNSTSNNTIWYRYTTDQIRNWVANSTAIYTLNDDVELTPEQKEAQRKAAEEYEKAVKRAQALLDSLLDEEQRKEAAEKKMFHIVGSRGRRYRIRTTHASGNVEEIDAQGAMVARLCAQPKGIPLGDQLLAQKLLLETDEDEFLKIANIMEGKPSLLAQAA